MLWLLRFTVGIVIGLITMIHIIIVTTGVSDYNNMGPIRRYLVEVPLKFIIKLSSHLMFGVWKIDYKRNNLDY